MKGNSINEISFKHLLRKENIIYGLVIAFLVLILYILLTIINFVICYRLDTYKYNMSSRIILLSGMDVNATTYKTDEELDNISSFPHVYQNISEVYYNPSYQQVKEFDQGTLKGNIQVRAVIDNNTIKIINGSLPKNSNEIVVPVKFYPYGQDEIEKDKIIIGKTQIGKTINLYSEKGYFSIDPNDKENSKKWYNNRKKIEFTIVGTYDSELGMFERNTCFVSMEALKELKDDYGGSNATVVAGGDSTYTPRNYGRMVIVDKYKNVKKVSDYLTEKGYDNNVAMSFDNSEYYIILLIPLIVSIIILVILFILIKSFINKKFKNNHKYLGMLKTFGYNNKEINSIMMFENFCILIISIIIAIILYSLLFAIMHYFGFIFDYIDYYSVIIKKPYVYMLISTMIFVLFVYRINNKLCNKYLVQNITNLLKED